MNYIAFALLFIVYTIRFHYDINYLYADCMKTNYTAIVLLSIIHSFITGFMASLLVCDDSVFVYALVFGLIIIFLRLVFGDCVVSILANKICGDTRDYMQNNWKYFLYSIVFLYVVRTILFILKCKQKKNRQRLVRFRKNKRTFQNRQRRKNKFRNKP
jgi:hypothetical protein